MAPQLSRPALRRILSGLMALIFLLAADVVVPPARPAGTGASPGPIQAAGVVPGRVLIDPSRLQLAPEVWGGYDRSWFPHWGDFDGDGCNTRQEVLIRDSVVAPVLHPERPCQVVEGGWRSPYDGLWTTDPTEMAVDHVVPLAEAWESGARWWSDEVRERFANDEAGLVTVSGASNQEKGASDPAGWLPGDVEARCGYAAWWIKIKAKWGLTADRAEIVALENLAATCG